MKCAEVSLSEKEFKMCTKFKELLCGSGPQDSIFRSEKMSLGQMFLQPEAAYETIAQLGEMGCVQFRDVSVKL